MRVSRLLLALVSLLALLAAACGDDGGSDLADGTTSTTAPADEPDPDGDPDMDDPGMDERDSDAKAIGPYCDLSAQAESRSAAFDPTGATAGEAEEFYRSMLALTEQGLEHAPDDVAGALAVQRDVLVQTIDLLEPAGWDVVGSVDGLTAIYETPEFLAASEVLETFDVEGCGFAADEDEPVAPPVDTAVEVPGDVPAEYADYCAAAFAASETADLGFDADAAEVEEYYRGIDGTLSELAQLAPPELVDAIATIQSNFAEIVRIFEEVDWDLDLGFAAVQDWAESPEVNDPMEAALDIVEGFDADVCGLS